MVSAATARRRTIWSGIAAMVGGLTAILMTPPFVAAYYRAYPGYEVLPFWLPMADQWLRPLLEFAAPMAVYQTYGRIYGLVFLLFVPATLALYRLRSRKSDRVEEAGFALVVLALLVTAIGVAGDYWADGVGFPFELLGLVALAVGSTVWGIGVRGGGAVPTWWAWLLIAVGPLTVAFFFIVGHIPSGPAFPFAVAWFLLGCLLVVGRVGRSPTEPVRPS